MNHCAPGIYIYRLTASVRLLSSRLVFCDYGRCFIGRANAGDLGGSMRWRTADHRYVSGFSLRAGSARSAAGLLWMMWRSGAVSAVWFIRKLGGCGSRELTVIWRICSFYKWAGFELSKNRRLSKIIHAPHGTSVLTYLFDTLNV